MQSPQEKARPYRAQASPRGRHAGRGRRSRRREGAESPRQVQPADIPAWAAGGGVVAQPAGGNLTKRASKPAQNRRP
eukprot:5590266-Alexandrium_andersonii.AAC.1